MRQRCISCGYGWAWKLRDVRLKCRRCKIRYRLRSAWEYGRLSEKTKKKLLEYFVLGVPAYRLRFRGGVSLPTMQKFFRRIRMVLAYAEECRTAFRGRVEIDETTFGGRRPGKTGWGAYGSLALRGGHVVVRKEKGRPKGRDHINGIEGFWSYAKHWLHHYRGVPQKFFHLYLGEISFRFNHREGDLFPLIFKLLQTTPLSDITRI